MNGIGGLFSAAMYALLLQNLIFTGGYGADEALRMAARPRRLLPVSAFIAYFSALGSLFCALLEKIPRVHALCALPHALVFAGTLGALYLATLVFAVLVLRVKKQTVKDLGVSAFNTLVLAVPFIRYRASFGAGAALGLGLGSGLAFAAAGLLIGLGLRRLAESEDVPECFKGTPALFVYVSILALAFTGFSGNGLNL